MQGGKLQPALNGIDGSSASNTPTHSRNNSSTSLNVMVSPSNGASGVSLDSMYRSVGDVFNGFVIGVHRKMVSQSVFLHTRQGNPRLLHEIEIPKVTIKEDRFDII